MYVGVHVRVCEEGPFRRIVSLIVRSSGTNLKSETDDDRIEKSRAQMSDQFTRVAVSDEVSEQYTWFTVCNRQQSSGIMSDSRTKGKGMETRRGRGQSND